MLKYQNYQHYKLPITINPLDYGKLIYQKDNLFIIQISRTNIVLITQTDNINNIKLFKEGDLMFQYKDIITDVSQNIFVRSLDKKRFSFKNNKLISTEKTIIRNSSILTLNKFLLNSINKNLIEYQDSNAIQVNSDRIPSIILMLIILMIFDLTQNHTDIVLSLVPFQIGNIIKLRKLYKKYFWNDFIFNINNKVFTKNKLEKAFSNLWIKIESNFTEDNHMFILLKIKYNNGEFSSIGKVQRINKTDLQWYIDYIIENMKFKSEYYNETPIESIIISYGFKSGKIDNKQTFNVNITQQNYKDYKLPITMNPLDYGKLLDQINNTFWIQINEKNTAIITKYEDHNEIKLFSSGIQIYKYKDIKIDENIFERYLDNKKFVFKNGEQILFIKEMKSKFISTTKKAKNLTNNFITLDIETFIHENTLVPYLICFYDGKNSYSFYLKNYNNVEEMILHCLKSILVRKYNGYKIYIHNMAKFDIIFLLKYLVKVGNIDPIIHNDRIISIKVNYGKDGEYQIDFKDSYLILLKSLNKLSKAFKVENEKTIFPYLFVNKDNLYYEGKVPDFKYFDNKITKKEYTLYKNKFSQNNWTLVFEAIKYCINDCISLYQVVFKFNEYIFNLFSLNIHHYPTLPSLAFAIYRSNFMTENTIPQLSGKIADDIRSGYTGGSCDVFIPVSKPGVKIKCLDVNSLYPSQMKTKLMPIGNSSYFNGDITTLDNNAFGFFYCKIIAPDDIKHPILQTHVRTNNGIRTISPLGTWFDMLFSEELYNARKYGYKIEILWGYTFEQAYIFEDYVDFLYNLRKEYDRNHPMNYIAKILLNSLYGRFGMDDNFVSIEVIHKDYYADFENKYFDNIIEKIELGEYLLVRYNTDELIEDVSSHNVSIGVAAAITAYARIHMSKFKNNPNINLYYTDTDSIYTDSDIEDDLISNTELGKLKLENTCKKAIFLTPKVYCLITESGETIYKAKGLKHEIELSFEDYEKLLYKDVLIEKTQNKWYRKLSEGKINILEEIYTLKANENKREIIYNKNNKFISTKPYKINESKDIRTK